MGWSKAVAAVAALLHLLAGWVKEWRDKTDPERIDAEREKQRQARLKAAYTGDMDTLAADIDRLRQRAKRRLSERLKQTCADEDRGTGPV